MPRSVYKFIDGECVEVYSDKKKEVEAPFVHQDSFKSPLRHPKTDEMVDSMTRWNEINKQHKLECVGNDLLSNHKQEFKERITDEKFNDAYEHAWNIESDPFKRNQRVNRQLEELEKYNKAKGQKLTAGMPLREIAQMMGLTK